MLFVAFPLLFLIRLFVFLLLSFKGSLYILYDNSLSDMCFAILFLAVCGLSFHSLDIVFHRAEVFNFNEVLLVTYFFYGSYLWCCI